MGSYPSLVDVKVGDQLIVKTNSKFRADYPVTVVKVARVWVTVVPVNKENYWEEKYRKDSGLSAGQSTFSTSGPRLTTQDQVDYEDRVSAARDYLRHLGVETYRMNQDVLTLVDLANLVRVHLDLEEL